MGSNPSVPFTLTKITHRTYKVLAYSYSLAGGDRLIYEGRAKDRFLVVPHTMSMYYALVAHIINFELAELVKNEILEAKYIDSIKASSYEEDVVERKYHYFFGGGYIDAH
jgi:hypothetical protein